MFGMLELPRSKTWPVSIYSQVEYERSGSTGRDSETCSSSAPDGVRAPGSKCAGKGARTGGGLVDLAGEIPIDVAVVVVVGLDGEMYMCLC